MATKKNYTIEIYHGNEFKFRTGSRGLSRAMDTATQWMRHNTEESPSHWSYNLVDRLFSMQIGKWCILLYEQGTTKPVRMKAIVESTTVERLLDDDGKYTKKGADMHGKIRRYFYNVMGENPDMNYQDLRLIAEDAIGSVTTERTMLRTLKRKLK